MKLKGICKYCLGCNKLEDANFAGTHRCSGFVQAEADWEEIYRKELKKSDR